MLKQFQQLLWIALPCALAQKLQQPWELPGQTVTPPAAINFTTLTLSSLATDDFTVLSHPAFPSHSVRIKKIAGEDKDWCDGSVNSYTGYIDTTEARHIFFYFFESRNDPASDDVIFWTNGGPGCSSSLGLLMELGPCRIDGAESTKYNEHSWNENANIFFIDQPIGVGFSYADYGEFVSTTEEAAQDIASFVAIFFSTFSNFTGRPFHMAGESYGGRYVPLFASAVYENNKVLKAMNVEPVNLKSVMIGNGMTDTAQMITSYYDIQCTTASLDVPFQDIATCVRMKTAIPRCQKMLAESCVNTFDAMGCTAAGLFCAAEFQLPMMLTGRNVYDVSGPCEGGMETLCYPIMKNITNYLNLPSTRKLLGVSPTLTNTSFSSCSPNVGAAFSGTMDMLKPDTKTYLEMLLERGVDVLIYVGTYDWICNWVGNERMVHTLEWSGAKEFRALELEEWRVQSAKKKKGRAGMVKSSGGLTFVTIEAAGHMVPYDKPVEALDMVQRWIGKKSFY